MLRIASLLALVMFIVAPAVAEDAASQIARCAAINSDILRLACFDAIARATKAPPSPTWQYSKTRDAMDDTEDARIYQEVMTEDGEHAAVVIWCTESRAVIALAVPRHGYDVAARESVDTTFRFDRDKPESRLLRAATDSALTFLVDERQAEIWSQMLKSKKMAVRFFTKGYGSSRSDAKLVTAVFDLTGLAEAAQKLKGCPAS